MFIHLLQKCYLFTKNFGNFWLFKIGFYINSNIVLDKASYVLFHFSKIAQNVTYLSDCPIWAREECVFLPSAKSSWFTLLLC